MNQSSHKKIIYSIEAVILVICVSLLAINTVRSKTTSFFRAAAPPIPTPTTIPIAHEQTTTFDASNGKKSLKMKKTINTISVSYDFSIIDTADSKETPFFSKTIDNTQSISIPFNAWSPDNSYLFLKEESAGGANYFVFNGSGKPMSDASLYIEVSALFRQKYPDVILTDVTGWADPGLLILNTNKKTGEQGSSYWFEVSRKALIQLSTRFN